MAVAYEAKDAPDTKKYKPKDGDTLASIVAANPDRFKSWEDLALYNWGTAVPSEVNRALRETVGTAATDPDDPSKTVVKVHADAPNPDILLPKPWTAKKLATAKTYVVQATRPRPPTAVSIDVLDKWFVPGKEGCQLSYSLEGLKTVAKKVQLEVYGSNYSAAGAWNKGYGTFPANADKKDVALYHNAEQADAPERAAAVAIKPWKGTVNATDGALGAKTPLAGGGTEDRVINVAFSPYTAHLRYYLDDADKKARVELAAFWVRFDAAGAPTAASLKIQWNVHGTTRFEGGKGNGQLLVHDKGGRVVYRKPLKADELKEKAGGMLDHTWAGGTYNEVDKAGAPVKNSMGTTVAIASDMPYRVQVQMHTAAGEAKGLAIAAMHTEVRIYVAPGTLAEDVNPYVATSDKPSLRLTASHDLLATKVLARGDGVPWVKLQLAKGGFHPGPIDANDGHPAFKISMEEFKRSVPKRKANAADPFARFTPVDKSVDDDVKNALEDLLANTLYQRPWFGDPSAGRADMDLPGATSRLNDATKEIVVWVDDRNAYTDPKWLQWSAQGPTIRTNVIGSAAACGNKMGEFVSGDAAVALKAAAIPRPFIPLAADFILMGQANELGVVVAVPADADLATMRKAIGPLRVDWTFDEIDAEPAVLSSAVLNVARYDKRVTRSHASLEAVLTTQKSAAYARKDVTHLTATYHNCPVDAGGIRPTSLATYYSQAFGAVAADALPPWVPLDDSGREALATIVHDNLGQAAADRVLSRIGMAGVYFCPSIIGGDGYRVRAQVRFTALGDYKLPNLDVLKARYPLLPQVQSAAMRVWKKCSFRGYVKWTDTSGFATSIGDTIKMFEPGFLHFVYERGDAAIDTTITDWFADDANYKAIVQQTLAPGAAANTPDGKRAANCKLTANRIWPWYTDRQYGIYEASPANATLQAAVSGNGSVGGIYNNTIKPLFNTLSNAVGLALVNKIEQTKGKLRGHVIVQMTSSEQLYMEQYRCATCASNYYYAEAKVAGRSMVGQPCPKPTGCAGTLAAMGPRYYGDYVCANGHTFTWAETTLAGGQFATGGYTCPTDAAALSAVQSPHERYKCTTCAFDGWLVEPGTGGAHEGEACMTVGCAGTLRSVGPTKERYTCDGDGASVELAEPTTAGGTHVGQEHAACSKTPKGHLRRGAPPTILVTHTLANKNKVIMQLTEPSGFASVPISSLGNPLGVAWNFSADPELWAHETAHCRHMEHAGNAGGFNDPQHDPVVNASFNWVAINETEVFPVGSVRMSGRQWDRNCFMTYANQRRTYQKPRDRTYPCVRCALKLRGWRLAANGSFPGVAVPAAGVVDP